MLCRFFRNPKISKFCTTSIILNNYFHNYCLREKNQEICLDKCQEGKLLSKLIWTPPAHPNVNDLQWFSFSISRIGDHLGPPLMLSRTGYTGELGYEIYCHPKDAINIWDAIWEAGKEFDLKPMGFEALDMLRIEAGLILGGIEYPVHLFFLIPYF